MSQPITHDERLHKPADKIACLIVRNIRKNMLVAHQIWLDQAMSGGADQNTEALHDFRVEMRRLRVWLQQARGLILTKSSARKQLKIWAKESNTNRDLEVMLDLLQQANGETTSDVPSIPLVQENKKLVELISQQPRALKTRTAAKKSKQPEFALWLAGRLSIELEKTLPLFEEDDETLHKARINIKHMRYLIEPIETSLDSAPPALSRLKAMQTTLGNLHDLFVLRQKLPGLLCGQLSEQLSTRLAQAGMYTKDIQHDFTLTRNQLMRYLRWQSATYDAAMKDWHSSSKQASSELINSLHQLMNELANA